MRRIGRLVFVSVLALCTCEEAALAPGETDLRLQIVAPKGSMAVDYAMIHLEGPTSVPSRQAPPGGNSSFPDLQPGMYTVAVEGILSGNVQWYYERSGIEVTAGRSTPVTAEAIDFGPPSVFPGEVTVQPDQSVTFQWNPVESAVGYVVEWDENPGFSSPTSVQTTATNWSHTFSSAGVFWVRVRASNRFGSLSEESNVAAVDVVALVGSWQATSFEALGTNFIAAGMTLDLTLSDAGTYTITVTNDLADVCGGETNCTNTGPYTSTATQITIDAGQEDEATFDYTVTSTTMTWTGTIDEIPVTVRFVRV